MPTNPGFTYQQAGVDAEQASAGLKGLLQWVRQTHALRQGAGAVRLPIGYYANVIDIGHGIGGPSPPMASVQNSWWRN